MLSFNTMYHEIKAICQKINLESDDSIKLIEAILAGIIER